MTEPTTSPLRDEIAGPRPLSDADLLAWAVVIGYRAQQQQRDGLRYVLLPYPPCPTCQAFVYAFDSWWAQDRLMRRQTLAMRPCGHAHTADEAALERISEHIGDMLNILEEAEQRPPGERSWTTDDVIRQAQARVGKPEPAATDATGVCTHPEGYDGECPCPPGCVCCPVTAAIPLTTLQRLHRLRGQLAAEHAKAVRADQQPRPNLDHLRVTAPNGIAVGLETAIFFVDHHLREVGAEAPIEHPSEPKQPGTTEAAIARMRHLADQIEAGAPWTSNRQNLARRIRDAIEPGGHDSGPTVAEAAADDRAYWTDRYDQPRP
ncbi:hypothetical protein AB0D78_28365 [Streptomyces avermitilis]|uniref:hypothetical protein n=1 Tax=Streptomyces avermitilis TaxID=33903 RepID=UPI0033F823CE